MAFVLEDGREICLVHANCLGSPLLRLLLLTPAFAQRYAVYLVTNYTKQAIPEIRLRNCSLFLYQYLASQWGDLSSEYLLSRLSPKVNALRLPIPFFKGYWPFLTNKFAMNFADSFLEKYARMGLSAQEIIILYMSKKTFIGIDLDQPVEESLNRLRKDESAGALPIANFIEAHWKEYPVFDTVNHPSLPLLHHIADGVLSALDMPPLSEAARKINTSCDDGGPKHFELPIHPIVAEYHHLPFAKKKYLVYGKTMSFSQYIACYIDCRLLGITDFISYLCQVTDYKATDKQ